MYKYDSNTGELLIDEDVYDTENLYGLRTVVALQKTKKPSLLSAKVEFFSEHISSSVDIETNSVTIS